MPSKPSSCASHDHTEPGHDFSGAGPVLDGKFLVNIPFKASIFLLLILNPIQRNIPHLGKEFFIDFLMKEWGQ